MSTTPLRYTLEDRRDLDFGGIEWPDASKVVPGDIVRLMFVPESADPTPEAMWVVVASAEAGQFTGTLDSNPAYVSLQAGEVVGFTSANIIGIWAR